MNESGVEIIAQKKKIRAVYFFLGSLIVALVLTWWLKEPGFTDSQTYVLFLLFFATGLWITEAIPAFAVALFIMAYLVFALGNPHFNSAPEKIDPYVNTFSSSVIWLLLGGFFLAGAMHKTKLDQKLLMLTLKLSGTKPKNIVIAFMCTTMVTSMIMSGAAVTAMMVAAVAPLLKGLSRSGLSKALLLGIATAAAMGGMGTIIASSQNALAAGILEHNGIRVDFLQWMLYGVPLATGLTAVSCFILLRVFIKDSVPVTFDFLKNKKNDTEREPVLQRNIVLVVLSVTVLFWLTTSLHGISVAAISAIPIVVLTLTGIITGNDVKALPWDTLFLVAGGLSLGTALESTHILEHYAAQMRTMNVGSFGFILILSYLTMIVSTVMSNSAASAILIPLGFAVLPSLQKEAALSIGLASSAGVFLPVSAIPNIIVYGTGLLKQKDFRLVGVLIGILGPLLAVLWVLLVTG
jgi:sodium-dependent dicarboxylate transporter 2/3/5